MNIKDILEDLGYELIDRGSHWRTNALYRNGNNKTSLQVYKDTGIWKDFGEDSEYLPFVELIKKTLGTNNPDILRKYCKGTLEELKETVRKESSLLKEEKTYPDNCLNRLLPHYDFYLDKGIKRKSLKDFECGLATNGTFYQRLVFPVRNNKYKIHGFSGRKVTKLNNNDAKWIQKGQKSKWIYPFYNIEQVRKEISKTRTIILVESVGDSLALYDKGIKNSLVTFGLSCSPTLCCFLALMDVNKIVFALNNEDEKGNIASVKNIVKLSKNVDVDKLFWLPPIKSDFGEMDTKDFELYKDKLNNLDMKDNHNDICKFANIIVSKNINKSVTNDTKSYLKKLQYFYG